MTDTETAVEGRDIAIAKAGGKTWSQIGVQFGVDPERARSKFRYWRKANRDDWQSLKTTYKPEEVKPTIAGLFPSDYYPDTEQIWEQAIKAQRQTEKRQNKRMNQVIRLPGNKPVGIAFLSDAHFGSPATDYASAKADAEIIGKTAGLYASEHGDGWDNWIVGRLQALQRVQVIGFDAERELFFDWLSMMGDKLLWLISGNHPWWTSKLSGIDPFVQRLRGVRMLYDPHEVYVTLKLGRRSWKILARHSWRGSSIFNPTHGIEVGWERRGLDFDIGIGGHTHTGTFCREFVKHGKTRYAVQVGTYKVNGDEYGRENGMAEPHGRGCGAMIFFPDGRLHWCSDLEMAADYLAWARAK